MATILSQRQAPDGLDVDCLLSDDIEITFHFDSGSIPDDVQAAVDELEPIYVAIFDGN